jgi:ribosomal protein S18 acetylase RimI-like enzyme
MAVDELRVAGVEYLTLATDLLRRVRVADPEAGLWEAADLQWWWRTPRRSDEIDQLFWVDDDGPVAAAVLTEWARGWSCDPIVVRGSPVPLAAVWAGALEAIDRLALDRIDVLAGAEDAEFLALLTGAGFVAGEGDFGITWLDARERPAVAALPEGFSLVDRARSTTAHPLRRRNGDGLEARLQQCSLYDATLDLAIEAPAGDVAGYALFWFDPVTQVGLVEPMRVEDAYQRRGLARALLTAGLDRLSKLGARRLKVGYGTDAARALYTGAGFRVASTQRPYSWSRRSSVG